MELSLSETIDRHTIAFKELRDLRSLGLKSTVWKNCSPEIKKILADQEYYLTEYVRNLNRQLYELTKYRGEDEAS